MMGTIAPKVREHYKRIKLKDGSTRDEHRLVMEKHLGRRLSRTEVVHHKNGIRHDNRIENLEVMSLSEHASLHRKDFTPPEVSETKKVELSMLNAGEGAVTAKLQDHQVIMIRLANSFGVDHYTLSHTFKICRPQISRICGKKAWRRLLHRPGLYLKTIVTVLM